MNEHGVQRLIHGHTHRPNIHDLLVNEKKAQRIVLASWEEQGSVLIAEDGEMIVENVV